MKQFNWGGRTYRQANLDEGDDLDGGDGGDVKPTWPDDWREQIAGEDEKELTHISKYATPKDIWTKARSLEQKISSGEFKQHTPFPEKGSDDDKAAWRESQGLPASFDKYDLQREIEDGEKETIDQFLEYAFDKNMSTQGVRDMVQWFYDRRDSDADLRSEGDKEALKAGEDTMRAEWGNDYRAFMNRIDNLVEMAPGDVKEQILDARLPDGTQLKANPDAMKFLLNMAIAVDPVTTIVPPGGDKVSSMQDELDEIKELMRTDRKKYNRDEKIQARYRELTEELLKHK